MHLLPLLGVVASLSHSPGICILLISVCRCMLSRIDLSLSAHWHTFRKYYDLPTIWLCGLKLFDHLFFLFIGDVPFQTGGDALVPPNADVTHFPPSAETGPSDLGLFSAFPLCWPILLFLISFIAYPYVDASPEYYEEDVAAGIDDPSDDWPHMNPDILSRLSRPSSWAPLSAVCTSSFHDDAPSIFVPTVASSPGMASARDHVPVVIPALPNDLHVNTTSVGACFFIW